MMLSNTREWWSCGGAKFRATAQLDTTLTKGGRWLLLVALFLCLTSALNAQQNRQRTSLAITYYDYPPNIMDVEGRPRGLFVSKLTRIADKAGVSIAWHRSTIGEEVVMLNDGMRAFCTSGKLFTKERAKNWVYIPYILAWTSPNMVITRRDRLEIVGKHASYQSLLEDQALVGALISRGAYGEEIDQYLTTNAPSWIRMSGNSAKQLMDMVAMHRADYAIFQQRQWQMALASGNDVKDLAPVPHLTSDKGYPVFLACSRTLEMTLIRALADSMAALGYEYTELHF